MARKKENRWDDIDGGSAFVIPYTLLRHPNFTRLSPFANKLLMDLARQYTGFNNGYLCSAWALMQGCGWCSDNTVRHAMRELEHYGIIVRTQHGGRNKPNLHALTWRRIDHKKEKWLEVPQSTTPGNEWKIEREPYVRTAGKRKPSKRPRPQLRAVS